MPDSATIIPATHSHQTPVLVGVMSARRDADGVRRTHFALDSACRLPTPHTTTHETRTVETLVPRHESSYPAVIGMMLGVLGTGLGALALARTIRPADAAPPTDFGS
ncbi:MAG: hypothetical protein NVS2B17_29070 [Candidatus Velthaea sp.]